MINFTLMPTDALRDPTTGLSGKRYGEVLLVTPGEAGPQATVYNSFPLNDCPAELWSALDAQAIATENGAATALLNGPRYWLMNAIEKVVPMKRAGTPEEVADLIGFLASERAAYISGQIISINGAMI